MVRGLEKFGGKIQLNAHVDEIIVDNGRATGIRLKNGSIIKAKKAVVSNATPFDTVKMLGKEMNGNWQEHIFKR
jgi:phytoene dehydrogenase-like protein